MDTTEVVEIMLPRDCKRAAIINPCKYVHRGGTTKGVKNGVKKWKTIKGSGEKTHTPKYWSIGGAFAKTD